MGLPADLRLRRGVDVTATVRRGRRTRAGSLVLHARPRGADEVVTGTPRLAFVAPRTVGPAVVRNRARRRVQEHVAALVRSGDLTGDVDLVVRLLPRAAEADHDELGRDLAQTLRRLRLSGDDRG